MNILFYVEPHPLRDSFTSHSNPYKIFLNICRQIKSSSNFQDFEHVDVRVFSNHVLQQFKFEESIDMWPLILTPTSDEQKKIEEMATLWLPNGVKDWLNLCANADSEITKFYIDVLSRIKKEDFDFDVIVSWGQNQAIKTFAENHDLQTVYLELASLRPPFPRALMMDPVGVNGAASSTYIDISDIKNNIETLPVDIMFTVLNDEFHSIKQASNLFVSRFNPTWMPNFENDRPTALVPLQLADDANLLLYSDFKSIEEFTENSVNVLSAHGWNVVIKPHPHAYLRGGYVEHAQQAVLKKYENTENIAILHDEIIESEYLSLISNVDLIVTNNSSVGFEGLLCGTQSVTLGKSCYSIINGLPTLEEFLNSDDVQKEKYKKNAAAIVTYMLAFMFPLERRLAHELVARIEVWRDTPAPPKGNTQLWIKQNLNSLGWSTWHEQETARKYFLKSDDSNISTPLETQNA